MSELRWILLGCGVLLLGGIFLWGRRSRGQVASSSDHSSHSRVDPPMAQPEGHEEAEARGEAEGSPDPDANRWNEEEWTNTVADLPVIRMDSHEAFEDPMIETTADEEEAVLLPAEYGVETEPNVEVAMTPRADKRADPAAAPPAASATREPARSPKLTDKRKIIALRLSAVPPDRYAGSELRSALESLGLRHGRYGIFHRLDPNGVSIVSVASMVEPGAFDLATMADSPFAGVTLFAMLPGPLPGREMCDQIFDCARQLEIRMGGALHDERGAALTDQRIEAIRDEVLDFEHLLGTSLQQP
ncbi:MAG: cell division protein ZipA C-terminal FtsZ-binding domain-containing protein [Steroidobacteraceae bacterium]